MSEERKEIKEDMGRLKEKKKILRLGVRISLWRYREVEILLIVCLNFLSGFI